MAVIPPSIQFLPILWEQFKKQGIDPDNLSNEETIERAVQAGVTAIESIKEPVLGCVQADTWGFRERLFARWGEPLYDLEFFIALSVEIGLEWHEIYRPRAAKDNDILFDVIHRLHARGCAISQEILLLLTGGFSDGALARWRSLHEVLVTARFIFKHGRETAERYYLYQYIESSKALQKYQEFAELLGYTPFSLEEENRIETIQNDLVNQYGSGYKDQYGWSLFALGKKGAKFSDIENDVGFDYIRPYYKMASNPVHGDPKGIYWSMGVESDKSISAGMSNLGLADPGFLTAESLGFLNEVLLDLRPNGKNQILKSAQEKIIEDISKKFMEIHHVIIEEEKQKNQET